MVFFLFIKKDEIRIRVIANSDSTQDVKEKEEVVSYLLNNVLEGKKIDDKYFSENYLIIESELKKVYPNVKVIYDKHTFYNKTYNGSVLADGTYKTLLVYIGNAEGSNWWSSVFDGEIHSGSEEVSYQWFINRMVNYLCMK